MPFYSSPANRSFGQAGPSSSRRSDGRPVLSGKGVTGGAAAAGGRGKASKGLGLGGGKGKGKGLGVGHKRMR